MTRSPLVTIGLPVYNSERYVRQSLDSLLAQTYSNFTLIINDNASTDGTAQICQEYVAADPRVKYFRNPVNIGNPRNFNRVFELTTTPYLKWSTSDDLWAPTFLERAMEVMEHDSSIALCYPKTYLMDAEGGNRREYEDGLHLVQPDPADRFMSLLLNIKLAHQHLGVIRTAFLRRTHLLGAFVASDINLLAELTLYGKFYELPERLFFRRFHKTSGSWKRGDAQHEAKHYHGSARQPGMRTWRGHLGLFAAVSASPLPSRSKLKLYRRLARRMVWDRHDLIGELWYKPGTWVTRLTGRTGA
jgi:glycosyltransferase involved in cell wall biosynthesis